MLTLQTKTFLAGDLNESIIKMWKSAQKGWKPPTKRITKTMYDKIRFTKGTSAYKGFVGTAYAFRGIYMGAYYKFRMSKILTNVKNVVEIGKKVKKVKFRHGRYTQFSKLRNYLIYCDPPYANTESRFTEKFESKKFWSWCQSMAKKNIVFVSEYSVPKYVKVRRWSISGKEKLYMIIP